MKRLRIFFLNFFGFTKTEANAAIVLIVLVILTALAPRVYLRLAHGSPNVVETDSTSLIEWHQTVRSNLRKASFISEKKPTDSHAERFVFDPNLASRAELERLGFPQYIATRIEKYRDAGGKFTSWQDLYRIYGIDSSLVTGLRTYIEIPSSIQENTVLTTSTEITSAPHTVDVSADLLVMDLNIATAEDLRQIKGIGPTYSERIVKYRSLLGGFHSQEQLSEVYGLRVEALDLLKNHTFIGEPAERNIPINSDSIMLLAKHPYLNWNQAQAIHRYREQHGDYEELEEITRIKIIGDSLYQKLLPYLSLDK